jgi:predicted O-methyltransferase YrrM
MPSKGYRRYQKQVKEFAANLSTGYRPTSFEAAYEVVKDKVSGQYKREAIALWDILSVNDVKSIVEVGRNLGGTAFLFACACPQLEAFLSLDIEDFPISDHALQCWFDHQGIDAQLRVCDSVDFAVARDPFACRLWDFVFIDGGHTGAIVREDIHAWKDHCRMIGFHDYADKGGANKHRRYYPDVVEEITWAAEKYNWQQIGMRGRSEVVFATESY